MSGIERGHRQANLKSKRPMFGRCITRRHVDATGAATPCISTALTDLCPIRYPALMRIIRFISGGQIYAGRQDRRVNRPVEGNSSAPHRVTDRELRIEKLLAPIVPVDILCIGLNYRESTPPSGSAVPKNPMLFLKASNAAQQPAGPDHGPATQRQDRLRGGTGRRDRQDGQVREARRGVRLRLRLHDRQRRQRRDWQRDQDLGGGQFARPRASTASARSARGSSPATRSPTPTPCASARCSTARSCRTRAPTT